MAEIWDVSADQEVVTRHVFWACITGRANLVAQLRAENAKKLLETVHRGGDIYTIGAARKTTRTWDNQGCHIQLKTGQTFVFTVQDILRCFWEMGQLILLQGKGVRWNNVIHHPEVARIWEAMKRQEAASKTSTYAPLSEGRRNVLASRLSECLRTMPSADKAVLLERDESGNFRHLAEIAQAMLQLEGSK